MVGGAYYPIDVVIGGKVVAVANRRVFLAHYKAIINDTVRRAVLGQDVGALFKNWRGIMLGRGEVWISAHPVAKRKGFKLYIIAINNETLAESMVREAAAAKILPQAPRGPDLPLSAVPGEGHQGVPILLRPVKDAKIAEFARLFLEGRGAASDRKRAGGEGVKVAYGEADLDGDGLPELFLQFDRGDLCGNDECRVFVFENEGVSGKLALKSRPICAFDARSAYGDAAWIAEALPEAEQGRHVLQIVGVGGDNGFVHWLGRRDKEGSFCKFDGGEPVALKTVRAPEVLEFVVSYLRRLGVSGSGAADRVLSLSLPVKCDGPGCEGAILIRSAQGFERVCSVGIFPDGGEIDPVSEFRVFAEKENEFHRVNSGEEILHWRRQAGADGDLCWRLKGA